VAPDQRRQHEQRGTGAERQQLPDRVGRDQKLSERIAEREHEHAEQHQADAGKARRARVAVRGDFCEQRHASRLLKPRADETSAMAATTGLKYRRDTAKNREDPAMSEFDPKTFDPKTHRMVAAQRWFEDFVLGERFVIPSRTMTSAVFAAFQTASGDTHPI